MSELRVFDPFVLHMFLDAYISNNIGNIRENLLDRFTKHVIPFTEEAKTLLMQKIRRGTELMTYVTNVARTETGDQRQRTMDIPDRFFDEPMFFVGGYQSMVGGHAVGFHVDPSQKIFTIFNSGDGVGNHTRYTRGGRVFYEVASSRPNYTLESLKRMIGKYARNKIGDAASLYGLLNQIGDGPVDLQETETKTQSTIRDVDAWQTHSALQPRRFFFTKHRRLFAIPQISGTCTFHCVLFFVVWTLMNSHFSEAQVSAWYETIRRRVLVHVLDHESHIIGRMATVRERSQARLCLVLIKKAYYPVDSLGSHKWTWSRLTENMRKPFAQSQAPPRAVPLVIKFDDAKPAKTLDIALFQAPFASGLTFEQVVDLTKKAALHMADFSSKTRWRFLFELSFFLSGMLESLAINMSRVLRESEGRISGDLSMILDNVSSVQHASHALWRDVNRTTFSNPPKNVECHVVSIALHLNSLQVEDKRLRPFRRPSADAFLGRVLWMLNNVAKLDMVKFVNSLVPFMGYFHEITPDIKLDIEKKLGGITFQQGDFRWKVLSVIAQFMAADPQPGLGKVSPFELHKDPGALLWQWRSKPRSHYDWNMFDKKLRREETGLREKITELSASLVSGAHLADVLGKFVDESKQAATSGRTHTIRTTAVDSNIHPKLTDFLDYKRGIVVNEYHLVEPVGEARKKEIRKLASVFLSHRVIRDAGRLNKEEMVILLDAQLWLTDGAIDSANKIQGELAQMVRARLARPVGNDGPMDSDRKTEFDPNDTSEKMKSNVWMYETFMSLRFPGYAVLATFEYELLMLLCAIQLLNTSETTQYITMLGSLIGSTDPPLDDRGRGVHVEMYQRVGGYIGNTAVRKWSQAQLTEFLAAVGKVSPVQKLSAALAKLPSLQDSVRGAEWTVTPGPVGRFDMKIDEYSSFRVPRAIISTESGYMMFHMSDNREQRLACLVTHRAKGSWQMQLTEEATSSDIPWEAWEVLNTGEHVVAMFRGADVVEFREARDKTRTCVHAGKTYAVVSPSFLPWSLSRWAYGYFKCIGVCIADRVSGDKYALLITPDVYYQGNETVLDKVSSVAKVTTTGRVLRVKLHTAGLVAGTATDADMALFCVQLIVNEKPQCLDLQRAELYRLLRDSDARIPKSGDVAVLRTVFRDFDRHCSPFRYARTKEQTRAQPDHGYEARQDSYRAVGEEVSERADNTSPFSSTQPSDFKIEAYALAMVSDMRGVVKQLPDREDAKLAPDAAKQLGGFRMRRCTVLGTSVKVGVRGACRALITKHSAHVNGKILEFSKRRSLAFGYPHQVIESTTDGLSALFAIVLANNVLRACRSVEQLMEKRMGSDGPYLCEEVQRLISRWIPLENIGETRARPRAGFEAVAEMFARAQQTELVDAMQTSLVEAKPELYQALMGVGKTSVILVLLVIRLLLRTDSQSRPRFSTVWVVQPSHLVNSTLRRLSAIVGALFSGRNVAVRGLAVTIGNQDTGIPMNKAHSDGVRRQVVVVSAETAKAFIINSRAGFGAEAADHPVVMDHWFRTHNAMIVDEVDSLLNPMQSNLNVTSGDPTQHPLTAFREAVLVGGNMAYKASPTDLVVLGDGDMVRMKTRDQGALTGSVLFSRDSKTPPDICIARRVSATPHVNRLWVQNSAVETEYFQMMALLVLRPIMHARTERQTADFQSIFKQLNVHQIANLSATDVASSILAFMEEHKSSTLGGNRRFVDKLARDLVSTSGMTYLRHFGSDPSLDNPVVIPFRALRTPAVGSAFSDPDVTTILTLVVLANNGLRDSDIEMLRNLARDMYANDKTLLAVFFKDIVHAILETGPSGVTVDTIHVFRNKDFGPRFRNDPSIVQFYATHILPHRIRTNQTVHNVSFVDVVSSDFCNNRVGMSGTDMLVIPLLSERPMPDGKQLYSEFKVPAEGDSPLVPDREGELSIEAALLGAFRVTAPVETVATVDAAIEIAKEYDVVIDVAAFFRDFTSQQVVSRIHRAHQEEGNTREMYIFVREDGAIMQMNRDGRVVRFGGDVETTPFYFYSQQFTVGVDILQPAVLRGLTIIHPDLRRDEVAQAVFRMRNMNRGHTTDFLNVPSVQKTQTVRSTQSRTRIVKRMRDNEVRARAAMTPMLLMQNLKTVLRIDAGHTADAYKEPIYYDPVHGDFATFIRMNFSGTSDSREWKNMQQKLIDSVSAGGSGIGNFGEQKVELMEEEEEQNQEQNQEQEQEQDQDQKQEQEKIRLNRTLCSPGRHPSTIHIQAWITPPKSVVGSTWDFVHLKPSNAISDWMNMLKLKPNGPRDKRPRDLLIQLSKSRDQESYSIVLITSEEATASLFHFNEVATEGNLLQFISKDGKSFFKVENTAATLRAFRGYQEDVEFLIARHIIGGYIGIADQLYLIMKITKDYAEKLATLVQCMRLAFSLPKRTNLVSDALLDGGRNIDVYRQKLRAQFSSTDSVFDKAFFAGDVDAQTRSSLKREIGRKLGWTPRKSCLTRVRIPKILAEFETRQRDPGVGDGETDDDNTGKLYPPGPGGTTSSDILKAKLQDISICLQQISNAMDELKTRIKRRAL